MIWRNVIANAVARAWGVVSVYLFVPLYLKFLGIEAYGFVGFYSTLLGVVAFADMGFTATLNREMARCSVRGDASPHLRNLLRTYETFYLGIVLTVSCLIWTLAPFIASRWLHAKDLRPQELTQAIRLLGIAIALQLSSGLYLGGLMGLQKQVRANLIQIVWGVLRGVGAVLALWLYSPSIIVFAFWQMFANAMYCLLARFGLWRALSPDQIAPPPRFRWQIVRQTWRYAAGVACLAVLSATLTQADKVAASRMVSLQLLGYYTLAVSLGAIPLMLVGPIGSAVFPRFTALVALDDAARLKEFYHRTCEIAAVAIIPAGLAVAVFSEKLIWIWTGSESASRISGAVAPFLVGGQLMQAATVLPYYLALAHGNVKLNVWIGLVSLFLIVPLLWVLIRAYGIAGAAMSWFGMNVLTLPLYMYFLHRRFLRGGFGTWASRAVLRPAVAALPCLLLVRWGMPASCSRLLSLALIGFAWAAAATAAVFTSAASREEFLRQMSASRLRMLMQLFRRACPAAPFTH